jgi:hypothetical protein
MHVGRIDRHRMYRDRLYLQLPHQHHHLCGPARLHLDGANRWSLQRDGLCLQLSLQFHNLRRSDRLRMEHVVGLVLGHANRL